MAISPPTVSRERILLMALRQALIMVLGALEDYLQIERSIVPRHKREQASKRQHDVTPGRKLSPPPAPSMPAATNFGFSRSFCLSPFE